MYKQQISNKQFIFLICFTLFYMIFLFNPLILEVWYSIQASLKLFLVYQPISSIITLPKVFISHKHHNKFGNEKALIQQLIFNYQKVSITQSSLTNIELTNPI